MCIRDRTGEGKLDRQTGMGKALDGILRVGERCQVPVIALGGAVEATEALKDVYKRQVYASADNLFTKTDYFGAYDPEVRTTSGDVYPQVKTYVFGLSITF